MGPETNEIVQALLSAKEIIGAIVLLGSSFLAIWRWAIRPLKRRLEADEAQSQKINMLIDELRDTKTQIDVIKAEITSNRAEYIRDRLQSLHEYHCNEIGWVSSTEKQRIIEWYEEYHNLGFNHIVDTYVDDIARLPEHPVHK